MPGAWKWQPARQSSRIPGAGHRQTPWRIRCRHGEDRPIGAGKPDLERPRNDRRFPPLGVKQMPSDGPPPFRRGGGGLTWRRSCYAQRLSLRGQSPRRCGGDFPETLHQARDNRNFPRPLRKSEARLRLACPPLAWRNGAPHERGAGGESDPRFLAAGAPRGRTKVAAKVATLCPPLRGGRSHHSDPWREGHRAGQEAGAGHSGAGQRRSDRPQLAHGQRPAPGGPWPIPPCPTRGTSRLPAGRRFRADPIRSDTTIDASIHGQEGPRKSDSKRWV